MRRYIDPIKIIKILPLSNKPGEPSGPNPWLVRVKKALRATREASARMLGTLHSHIARVRPPLQSVYERLVSRAQPEKREEAPGPKSVYQPNAEGPVDHSARPVEGSPELEIVASHAMSVWFISIRDSVMAVWQARRVRLDMMKNTLAGGAVQCGKRMRQAWGTQASWRNKTEQVIRPLTSAVRSLRRRHQRLVDQLNSTHSIIQSQQQEITELAFQLASVQTELATHTQTIEELTRQLHLLQTQTAQSLPATHGTTGQSGPSSHGRRGAAATKRSGPDEPGAQSRAEH
jgi:hypothetical protein